MTSNRKTNMSQLIFIKLSLFCEGVFNVLELTKHNNTVMWYIFKGIKRNIVRTKFFSLLNVLGLVLGITSALLLFAYVQNEFRFDTYHAQHQDIVRISCSTVIDDKRTEFAPIPPAFGPAIKESIPEIAYIARVSPPYAL
ncbi:MAG: ABC transporter permease, partial [Flammeovirgaceae bacterium]